MEWPAVPWVLQTLPSHRVQTGHWLACGSQPWLITNTLALVRSYFLPGPRFPYYKVILLGLFLLCPIFGEGTCELMDVPLLL